MRVESVYRGMPIQRTSLNVFLTPELWLFIIARVASGQCQTASEVVRAGLRLLEQSELRAPAPVDVGIGARPHPKYA